MSCPVCHADRTRPRLRKAGVDVLFCGDCGVGFWLPKPGFEPSALYDESYFSAGDLGPGYDDYGALESALRATFARRLRRLPAPAAGARLLDVGSAYAFAVEEARRLGWHALGLEVSRAATSRAAATPHARGRVVLADGLAAPFASKSFDALTLWDVLEHLPDPHAAIAEAARLLRPGGRLALTTGDAGSLLARVSRSRWHLYTIPEHLFFHTRESLRCLLGAHGFRIERMRAEGAVYPLGYLVERLRKTLLRRPAAGKPRWPGANLCIPVNLFDVLTVQAVREPD